MAGGRPSEYNDNMLVKAQEYLAATHDFYDDKRGADVVNLPTIEGLAIHLNVARSTLYLWKEEHGEFSDILDRLQEFQAQRLINKGLSGNYNSTIAKLLLTKHGYSDKMETDLTSGGKPIPILGALSKDVPTDHSDQKAGKAPKKN